MVNVGGCSILWFLSFLFQQLLVWLQKPKTFKTILKDVLNKNKLNWCQMFNASLGQIVEKAENQG